MRLEIPGFLDEGEPGHAAIPIKQAWVQAMAGKQVRNQVDSSQARSPGLYAPSERGRHLGAGDDATGRGSFGPPGSQSGTRLPQQGTLP